MALIHILDKQSDKIIGTLNLGEYTDDEKVTSSENENTFDFTALKKFDILQKRNRLLLQDRDGFFSEFLIVYAEQNSRNQKFIKSNATFTDLQKAKIIEPQVLQGATADTAMTKALEGTEWRKGKVDYNGIRTLKIEEYTNPYNMLKRIASEFGLDLRFRVAVEGNKIVRYVDLTLPDDEFDGKEVVFGKDLIDLRRIEDAQNIVTALLVLGPEQEDGTRQTVLVEDNDALQRWGRNGQHLIEVYEPQITAEEVTVERLRTLGQNALQKRIDAIVTYECQAAIMEHIPGKEHEKVRLDSTIRIKDEGYTPPLYVEAKVLEIKEQPSTGKILDFKLGNYKEFSKADLEAQVAALKKLLSQKASNAKLVETYELALQQAEEKAAQAEENAKGYTDTVKVEVVEHANTVANQAENNAKSHADTVAGEAESNAKAYALSEANKAKEEAKNAQLTADGKNTVFYQATAPSTVGRKVNDLWYDTDDGYKPYYFNGSSWIPAPFGNAAIANLDVGKIVGDQGNFNWLEAKHIKSLNGLNIGNGQFVVDANGNVKFAGNLEGASGTFGEVTVKDGDFYLKDTKSGIRYSLVKKTNILGDHSFELIKISEPTSQDNIDHWWLPIITDNTNWETIGSPRGVPISIAGPGPSDAMPIFGNRALLVNSTNYIEQPVWDISSNTQYTFSVHAKRPYNNTPGAVRLEVYYYKLNIDGTSTRQLVAAQSFDTVASDYSVSRHALTFTSPNVARTGSDEIIFVIKGVNDNWVHVDGVQVVKSAYPTVYDTEDSLWSFMNSRNGFKARAIWTEGIYNGVNGIDIDDNRIRIYSNESLNYFSVENIESRFSTVPYDQWNDPEPNVKKAIKVNGGISTDVLYANTGSISEYTIATSGKIYVGGEGIELSWVGGTPYIDFSRRAGVDFDMRLILETDSGLAIRSSDNIVRHKFYANGTKSGGTIEIDGKILGMSPIDSPQVLLETIEFDVPLTADGTKVLLDSRFAKAVNYRFAVFPNRGEVIEKGADYFIIAGDGLADIRIVGERVGYAGVYFDDMTMEGVA
ncbi:phage tail spike protein [Caldifermentibacillus hisashii]|uniref:phage tail spike protein n=1 Tax=Caldifermentibacillus hisashii TaxID=996558 RepID=UPI001C11DA11|nr:phage tail spike protein [Caldifermentibacillus hisashii]MBU5342275.1 phage tail protein [Caldifermentibacillus hisashii]